MIEEIQVYCRLTGAAPAIVLRFSPHPCLGPLYTVTIVPGAAWGWVGVAFEEMWNYDSLFIWIHSITNAEWGYDEAQPYDGHVSLDTGATWADWAARPFIRAVYTGETPGDVPVSGIINNIPIPAKASVNEEATGVVAQSGVNTYVVEVEGAGTLVEARVEFETSVVPSGGLAPPAVHYVLYLVSDGVTGYAKSNRSITQSVIATFGRCSAGEFYQGSVADPAWDRTLLYVRAPVQFRRQLVLRAMQTTGVPVTVRGVLFTSLMR